MDEKRSMWDMGCNLGIVALSQGGFAMPEGAARGRPDPAGIAAGQRLPNHAERWLSGRKHRTRNAACRQPYRGFESHPLRQGSNPIVSHTVPAAAFFPRKTIGSSVHSRLMPFHEIPE